MCLRSVIDSQKESKCDNDFRETLASFFCSYHIFDVICDLQMSGETEK